MTDQQTPALPEPDVYETRFDSTCLWTPMDKPKALERHKEGSAIRTLYNEFTVGKLVARIAELEAAARGVDTRPPIGQHDVSRAAGGRAYVAEFFAKRLRRHDFSQYISERLAADFACALAQYLSEHDTPPAAHDEKPVATVGISQPGHAVLAASFMNLTEHGRATLGHGKHDLYARPVSAPAVDAGARDEREAFMRDAAECREALQGEWRPLFPELQDEPADAAITACALMIKGICLTKPNTEWVGLIEGRIRYMLKARAALSVSTEAAAGETIHQTSNEHGHVWRDVTPLDYEMASGNKRIVYTAPPAASGQKLTDERIVELARDHSTLFDDGASIWTRDSLIEFARVLLRASEANQPGA